MALATIGYGDGSGSGYGYGDGDGSGYGDGSGDGYGYGDGDGSGYGYGDGDGEIFFNSMLDAAVGPRASTLREQGHTVAFWWSDAKGKPANGGSGPTRKVGMVEEIKGPLQVCTPKALHGTLAPWKWRGERLWAVALYAPVQSDTDKFGSLKREILAEIVPNPFKEIES